MVELLLSWVWALSEFIIWLLSIPSLPRRWTGGKSED